MLIFSLNYTIRLNEQAAADKTISAPRYDTSVHHGLECWMWSLKTKNV